MADDIDKMLDEAGDVDMSGGRAVESEDQDNTSQDNIQDAKDQNEDTSSDDPQDSDTSSEDANTPESEVSKDEDDSNSEEDDNRLDKNPRFQQVVRRNREYKDALRSLEDKFNNLQGQLEAQTRLSNLSNKEQETKLTPEQEQAKEQLFDMLGLRDIDSTIRSLKEENDKLNKHQRDQAFNTEEKQLLDKIDKFGLGEPDDVMEELENHIDKHPLLSGIKDKPGTWTLAMKDLYSERFIETGKSAAMKEEVKRREKIKGSMTEKSSKKAVRSAASKGTGDALKDTIALIDAAGGEDAIDFSF